MRNAPIVAGVPTPYTMHVHPWPTRFHGPQYVRPVFGFPMIARTQQVFTQGYDIDRNAPQPPISGLGNAGEPMRLWNEGEGIFRPGGYGGGVFDNNISGLGSLAPRLQKRRRQPAHWMLRGLGDDAADYPWGVKSANTIALQSMINAELLSKGMCPIGVDGKLGNSTCGAASFLGAHGDDFPSGCTDHQSTWKAPTKNTGKNCGAAPGTSISPASPLPQPPIEAGMSSSTKRALGFALGGVLAIGAVVMMRKKK